jgi:nucleoid-associated protein YgaU
VRLLGSAALSLFLLGGLGACSGQQQVEDEVVDQQQDGGGGQDAAQDEQASNQAGEDEATDGGGENQANEASDEAGGQDEAVDGGDNQQASADGGNQTENDLQEIIQEMNGQQTAGAGDTGAEATAPMAPEPAPVDTASAGIPTNTAAAPAAPAAPAQPEASALPFQPGGSPAAPGLPELGSKMAYIVQHGDTLAKISQKIYGKGDRWKELATLSGLANPSRIFPGDLVYYTLDESAVAFATAYEQVQRSEEQVKPGDTLATIAARVYGDSNAWRSIWRQNDKIDNPDVIPPGTTVYYVPKGALSAAIKKIRATMATVANLQPTQKVTKTSKNLTTKTLNDTTETQGLTNAKKLSNSNGVLTAQGHISLSAYLASIGNAQTAHAATLALN